MPTTDATDLCHAYAAAHGHLEGDTLRVIVDQALRDDPAASVADIRAIVVAATADWELETALEAAPGEPEQRLADGSTLYTSPMPASDGGTLPGCWSIAHLAADGGILSRWELTRGRGLVRVEVGS